MKKYDLGANLLAYGIISIIGKYNLIKVIWYSYLGCISAMKKKFKLCLNIVPHLWV